MHLYGLITLTSSRDNDSGGRSDDRFPLAKSAWTREDDVKFMAPEYILRDIVYLDFRNG